MYFGGLQKNSMIDFPGKISCVLFLAGCNFDCPYCHNPGLVRGETVTDLDEDRIFGFLKSRINLIEGVVISGGEPTLCRDLFRICEKIKEMGFSVKIDTNGTRPAVVEKLIESQLVDYMAMDIKTSPYNYSPLITKKYDPEAIFQSISAIMNSPVDYEFRTTCIKPLVTPEVINNISKTISGARLYMLQKFRDTKTLHPDFIKNNDVLIGDDEMQLLKAEAEKYVSNCKIR